MNHPPIVEFLVTGDEVMRGTIADTNTARTAAKLYPLGVRLKRTTVVADRGEDIRRGLLEIAGRADFCVVSGGLGPTADDLTAACAAQAAGVELKLDQPWLDRMRARWSARRKEPMPVNNERQAWLPATAGIVDNPEGSAPAFTMVIDRCRFYFLPGVPREYHRIVDESVVPALAAAAGAAALRTRVLQCVGITESRLDEVVAGILAANPEVRFGFRTKFPENHLSLAALAQDGAAAEASLARVEALCRAALGGHVYGADGVTFAAAVGRELAARGQTIAVAESCTGGMLGQLLSETAGSSAWLAGGVIAYSNAVKERALGVQAAVLAAHGAVSEETAREMAEGARRLTGASWAAAITGIAGPDGGTAEKPVGTVWLALAGPGDAGGTVAAPAAHRTVARLAHYRGDREQVRLSACYGVLQMLREALGAPVIPLPGFERGRA